MIFGHDSWISNGTNRDLRKLRDCRSSDDMTDGASRRTDLVEPSLSFNSMFLLRWLGLLLTAAPFLAGCSSTEPEESPLGQPGTFAIQEIVSTPTSDGTNKIWNATIAGAGGPAFHFGLELRLKKGGGGGTVASSNGAFTREKGNDGTQALRQIAKAVEAKTIPTGGERVARLDFSLVILGTGMSRRADPEGREASFFQTPRGNWIATKAILKAGEAEVFLNINPNLGVGEFAPEDPKYGNAVVAELAKIFLP